MILSNFNGGHTPKGVHWPREVEKSLEDYVSRGGGLVIYHSANNSFPDWTAYNEMIGLGWRDRSFGTGLIVSDEEKVVEIPRNEGRNPGHGPEHDFQVTVLDPDHPITTGLPKKWMHPHEQLTHGQHGPAKNLTVLTYAYSKDAKENEVMDWATRTARDGSTRRCSATSGRTARTRPCDASVSGRCLSEVANGPPQAK